MSSCNNFSYQVQKLVSNKQVEDVKDDVIYHIVLDHIMSMIKIDKQWQDRGDCWRS